MTDEKLNLPPAEHVVEVDKKLWEPNKLSQRRGLAAVVRGVALNGRGKYLLGGGTNNPNSPTPWSWVNGVYVADCSRFVMWCLKVKPGGNPQFPEYSGDINVDSMMMDAAILKGGKGLGKFFRYVPRDKVYPGCIVAFRSIRAKELPKHPLNKTKPEQRVRIGHVGLVAGWEGLVDPQNAFVEAPDGTLAKWDGKLASLVTVECCASTPAIRFRRNRNFLDGHEHFQGEENPNWGVFFLEYVGP